MPLAPARFSTTTDWPRLSVSFADRMRAATSVPPPAAKPTIILIGLSGYRAGCALTCAIARLATIARPSVKFTLVDIIMAASPNKRWPRRSDAARPFRSIGCSLMGLLLELREVSLAAHRHRHDLARARIAEHDFELAVRQVAQRRETHLGAACRQVEHGPLARGRIVFRDLIGGPHRRPDVVALVHDGRLGLMRGRVWERHEAHVAGLGVDAREVAAPGIGDPEHAGRAIDADPARPLRPRERRGEVLGRVGVVELEVRRRDDRHLLLYGRQLPFQRLAGFDGALGGD